MTEATIQPAKRTLRKSGFLQIKTETGKGKQPPKLTRVAFKVSRLMEFCTLKELQNQTGHYYSEWPLVVLKELMDNALDACEESEIAPVISLAVKPASIVIQDNGGGISTGTIKSILDYSVRVSSREAYASPTRGAQGNALKTILAMGYVLDRNRTDGAEAVGETVFETRGTAHKIQFRVDHVNNEPRIPHTTSPSTVTVGTRITIKWPETKLYGAAFMDYSGPHFLQLASAYCWLNPHLTMRGTWNGKVFINVKATNPDWSKWGPRDPTSAHWYDEARFQRYMGAHVARNRDIGKDGTVREFIAEIRGFSGSGKQRKVLEEVGCSHVPLSQFFGIKSVNSKGIAKLLASLKNHSKPVDPKLLGIIGADHIKKRFAAVGGNPKTFKYTRRAGTTDEGIPYLIEMAFGLHQSALEQEQTTRRRIICGANWSPGINNPFRSFGRTGEGLETTLSRVRANAQQPVICVMHLASAHIQYADRGKSSIIIDGDVNQDEDE